MSINFRQTEAILASFRKLMRGFSFFLTFFKFRQVTEPEMNSFKRFVTTSRRGPSNLWVHPADPTWGGGMNQEDQRIYVRTIVWSFFYTIENVAHWDENSKSDFADVTTRNAVTNLITFIFSLSIYQT